MLILIYVAKLDLACSKDEVNDHVCIKIGAHESHDNIMMENVPSLVLVKDPDWNPLNQRDNARMLYAKVHIIVCQKCSRKLSCVYSTVPQLALSYTFTLHINKVILKCKGWEGCNAKI